MDGLNLSELAKYFGDEDAARELLEKMRWPNGAACPRCGGTEPYKLTPKPTSKKPGRKGLYKCRACRKQFTVTVGTVFEDSHIPLSKWLLGIQLLASSKKGISAHQLHRNLGISYKGAWFMAHRLRYAMQQEPLAALLKGTVEVDETYVGGPRKRRVGRPGPGDKTKTPVMALVERGGRVRAFALDRVTSANAQDIIRSQVDKSAHIMTDELNVYHALHMGYKHDMIRHSDNVYVRGNVHTNTVEGFFGIFKRGLNGVYHHISRGHMTRYLDEFVFRYDLRKMSDGHRSQMMVFGAEGKRLTYKQPARES